MKSTRLWLGLLVAVVLAACSGQPTATGTPEPAAATPDAATTAPTTEPTETPCDESVTWTDAEVSAGALPQAVKPVYAVPKCWVDAPVLAFITVDEAIPVMAEFGQGLRAAAAFYGIELTVADLRNQPADTLNVFETLLAKSIDVVGTSINPSDSALQARAEAEGVTLVLSGPSFSDPPATAASIYGENVDAAIGTEVGHMIGEEAVARLAGVWSGRNVVFVGIGEDSFPPTEIRISSSLAAARTHLDIPDSNVVRLSTGGSPETAQNMVTDTLTARPNDVFIMAPLNDETGIGGVQAVRNAGRGADAIISLWGGGLFGRQQLRNDTDGIIVGAVYQNAFADGWTWVEAAIAVARGDEFGSRAQLYPRITKDNVDELFPSD